MKKRDPVTSVPLARRLAARPSDVDEETQRRDYHRIRDVLPIRMRPIEGREEGSRSLMTVETADISGGGLLIRGAFKDSPKAGQRVELEIGLPSRVLPSIEADIVRTKRGPNRSGIALDVAVRFVEMPEAARREIVRHVFARELSRCRVAAQLEDRPG